MAEQFCGMGANPYLYQALAWEASRRAKAEIGAAR
jgi:hypothetical protein